MHAGPRGAWMVWLVFHATNIIVIIVVIAGLTSFIWNESNTWLSLMSEWYGVTNMKSIVFENMTLLVWDNFAWNITMFRNPTQRISQPQPKYLMNKATIIILHERNVNFVVSTTFTLANLPVLQSVAGGFLDRTQALHIAHNNGNDSHTG